MNRREFLSVALPAAAAVGGGILSSRTTRAQTARPPAPAREGEVRITDVKTYPVHGLLVQITTDAGIDGWGEINTFGAKMARAVVETYKPLLIGVNPTRIEHLWQMLFRAHRNVRGGLLHTSAIGGIDIALWDILGKLTKQPVYVLLGGAAREKILHYPSAKAWKQTTGRLHPMVGTPAHIDGLVGDLEGLRQKLGPGGYLMVDGHGKFTATAAIQLCKRIEHLGILFFEEVVPPENNEDLLRVKRATSVPLAVGERMGAIWPFRRPLEDKSVDVLNPDVVEIGGISPMRKLAGIAEMFDLPLAPHGNHSAIGTAASLHVDAAINNFLIQECYEQNIKNSPYLAGLEWPRDGAFGLPAGPGLGITVNLDGLKEAAAKNQERAEKGIEKAHFLEDGSVADR